MHLMLKKQMGHSGVVGEVARRGQLSRTLNYFNCRGKCSCKNTKFSDSSLTIMKHLETQLKI